MWMFGTHLIDWHEFDSVLIKNKSNGARIRPYERTSGFRAQISGGVLRVKGLAFFAAMARTGLARTGLWIDEAYETMAAWLQYARHFSTDKDIRLRSGACQVYKDAMRIAWAARLVRHWGTFWYGTEASLMLITYRQLLPDFHEAAA